MPTGAAADPKLMAEIAGDYQLNPGPLIEMRVRDGKLLATVGSDEGELDFVEGMTFYVPRFRGWVTFERDASGKFTGLKGYFGEDVEATRK
jgi:hypothetical protein